MWTSSPAPTSGTGEGIGGSCSNRSVNRNVASPNSVLAWNDDTTMPCAPPRNAFGRPTSATALPRGRPNRVELPFSSETVVGGPSSGLYVTLTSPSIATWTTGFAAWIAYVSGLAAAGVAAASASATHPPNERRDMAPSWLTLAG